MKQTLDYSIEIPVCYSHRVWDAKQTVDASCRRIHGHSARIRITLRYNTANCSHAEIAAVATEVSTFFKTEVHNRFIIDDADPMFYTLVASLYEALCSANNSEMSCSMFRGVKFNDKTVAYFVDLAAVPSSENTPVHDVLSSYFIVNFCPSSGNLCRWLFTTIEPRFKSIGADVVTVEWQSTPDTRIIIDA